MTRVFFVRKYRLKYQSLLALCGVVLHGCGVALPLPTDSDREFVFNADDVPLTPIASTESPVFHREAVFESIPGKIGSHAATITTFADGELLAAWMSYKGPYELDGSDIYMARRLVGQDGWTEPVKIIDRLENVGNPVLYAEQDHVWLFHAVVLGGWSTSQIFVQQSADRGQSWLPTKRLPGVLGSNVRNPPVRTNEGTLLLPAYDDLFRRSLFFTSDDGQGWTLIGSVETTPPNLQPAVARLVDGRLLAVMRDASGGWLWAMDSVDSGRSWSLPRDSGFPNPGSGACLLSLANGHVLLVFNDSSASRAVLSAAVSADGGITWPIRKVLADSDGDEAYYPAAIQTPDGLIHIVFTFNRDRIEHITLNEAWLAQ